MLNFAEKRLAEKFLTESRSKDIAKWHEWVYSLLFVTGGAVVVIACLATLNSLSVESIKLILVPGISTGMALLLAGALGLHLSEKATERKLLAGVLEKLIQ